MGLEVGEIRKNSFGDDFEVLELLKYGRCNVKFLDEFKYIKNVDIKFAEKGTIRNPYSKSVRGVGYLGVGDYNSNSMGGKIYRAWSGVLERSSSIKFKEKYKSYKNVTVCEEWYNFQVFAKWFDDNYPKHIDGIKFELDKDLLQRDMEDKIYSPETCLLLPKRINGFMVNLQIDNKSGHAGVYYYPKRSKWWAMTRSQDTKRTMILGVFETKEEAIVCYSENRNRMAEELKDYMRSLGYLKEEIIQLLR